MLNYRAKAVAANIRSKRIELNYTQEYLAAKLNISQNAYSKIEFYNGKLDCRLFEDELYEGSKREPKETE